MKKCEIISARHGLRGVMIEFGCGVSVEANKHSRWKDWKFCPFCGGRLNGGSITEYFQDLRWEAATFAHNAMEEGDKEKVKYWMDSAAKLKEIMKAMEKNNG